MTKSWVFWISIEIKSFKYKTNQLYSGKYWLVASEYIERVLEFKAKVVMMLF